MPDEDNSADAGLIDLQFKPPFLARHGLPDIPYPVRPHVLDVLIGGDSDPPFAEMLYGLQHRSSERTADWEGLEPALDRLAELIAPDDHRTVINAAGDSWWLEIGPVDLDGPIVTIQRGDQLIAAIGSREDGRLRVAAYRPLDAKSADYLTGLSLLPQPDGGVCMRANNWEYAKDCSAGAGNYYAFERGEAHLSWWEHGIGVSNSGEIDPHWRAMLSLVPRRPAKLAIELGVRYSLGDEE